ncbi:hypothetical protein [Streptomyces sp. NPDC050704]|uniref:hypothetical protein n=1 Tax=Streptomyces sp. NPDC050704 TaxID=3157219 RepID=UPI003418665D
MHTYDASRRLPYTSSVPAMRPGPETAGAHSATPIYDSLYSEYRRTFRTLPGDRNGEEEFGFMAFGASPQSVGLHSGGLHGTGLHSTGSYHSGSYNPGSHAPGSYGMRQGAGQQQTGHAAAHHGQTATSVWQPVARMHATGLVPAALPPGPRRER